MKFFEDIGVGEISDIGRHTFTAEDIKAFATRFDPQPFHLDEALAARSQFGRLCASGWHTACVWMRLLIDFHRREDEGRRARGEAVAQLGPSPGFRDLKWLKPVYVGDTISYADCFVGRLYVILPSWQMECGLGYEELVLLRGVCSGRLGGFPLPVGLLAERLGTAPVLAFGTALAGTGYCLAGASAGFGLLVLAL